ncbi:MAG: M20/M25/M40 family metallo-hydrolase [Erysipelotrichaceae bacterium]|nr:M20/M25/M40 family metallo-hydrolase [Erysipelotrichaceae bacterium]
MKLAIETAEENGIPYQTSLMKHGGTDAGEFQKVGSGVPVLLINVPCRYPHTPTSMIHYDDYENAVKLLTALVKKLDQKTVDGLTGF